MNRRPFFHRCLPGIVAAALGARSARADVSPELRLATFAARFRLEGGADFSRACGERGQGDAVFRPWRPPVAAPNRPPVWESFMTTSVILAGAGGSPTPVAGFYNPFFDALLLTKWNLDLGRVLRASLIPGEFLRTGLVGPSVSAPTWMRANGAFDREIPRLHALTEDKFSLRFPPRHTDGAAWLQYPGEAQYHAALERLLLRSIIGLAFFQRPGSPQREWMTGFRAGLGGGAEGIAAALAPSPAPLAAAVATLPAQHRRNLKPLAHFGAGGLHHLFFVDPLLPKFFLTALVEEGPPTRLRSASWLALDRAPPADFHRPSAPNH